jgi:asparagine synthase (glutamine-hydrolysing)
MCGIAAILDPDGTHLLQAAPAVTAALRHRGPDGEGVARLGPALLVHTRLAIIDVEGGDQPLVSEDGACTAIVNGEIYNHLALRRELEHRGHRFATRSDSEAVLHAYEEWGTECVRRLNGMFAFALWDAHHRRLVLARDQYGVKPLYWWSDGRRLVAASEVRALLAAKIVEPAIDPVALDHYLAWRFVPSPRTLFAGISKLAAASCLVAEDGQIRVCGYREPPGPPLEAGSEELEVELCERLIDAAVRQTMSDVPYGAFLSGGLDSAAIAAAMAGGADGPPNTFTIGFPGHDGAIDERAAAAETARLLMTSHRDTAMLERGFQAELAHGIRHLEEPCGLPSAPALLQLSRFARRHVKVVLSGQGADEPLGGYQRHQAAAALGTAQRVPVHVAAALAAATQRLPRNERAKRAARLLGVPPGDALLRIFEITEPSLRMALRRGECEGAAEERRALADGVLADVADRDVLEQALYLDTHLFLPDGLLVYGDKMTMAYGLEQRVPFLDVELMRFVERIPAHLRVHRFTNKWLYRRALRRLVPHEILARRKHPFATPYDRWLRSSMGREVERRFSGSSYLGTLIDPGVVSRLAQEHRSGRHDHKRVLYCLLELAEWSNCFIDAETEAPALTTGAAGR